jgi:hypothetical protein
LFRYSCFDIRIFVSINPLASHTRGAQHEMWHGLCEEARLRVTNKGIIGSRALSVKFERIGESRGFTLRELWFDTGVRPIVYFFCLP